MSEIVLPSVLHNSLLELLSKNKLCSWNIHGGSKFTSLTIKFDTTQGSHFVSTGYRRKSPCELRRDEQRATVHRQQVLSSTPAEHASKVPSYCSVSDEDDRRSDIPESDNDTEREHISMEAAQVIIKEMREFSASFLEDTRKRKENEDLVQCLNSDQSLAMYGEESSDFQNDNSNEPLCKNDLSDSTVEKIMADWLDKDVTFTLCSLKRENQEEIIQSMIDNGPVVDTIVHDKRLGANDLITRTKDFVFVYDISSKKVSDYRVICKQTNCLWPQRDYLKCLVNWPQCNKTEFSEDIHQLRTHIQAFYQSLITNFKK